MSAESPLKKALLAAANPSYPSNPAPNGILKHNGRSEASTAVSSDSNHQKPAGFDEAQQLFSPEKLARQMVDAEAFRNMLSNKPVALPFLASANTVPSENPAALRHANQTSPGAPIYHSSSKESLTKVGESAKYSYYRSDSGPACGSPTSSNSTPGSPTSSPTQRISIQKQLVSGLIGSVIAEAATFPLETIKILQQVRGDSVRTICLTVMKEQGIGGFFHGATARLLQTVSSNVGFFFWQSVLKNFTGRKRSSLLVNLALNMLSQQINRCFTLPIEVVANVSQANRDSKGIVSVIRQVLAQDGVRGFWKGLGISLILSLNPALMFTLVDKLTLFIKKIKKVSHISASQMFQISAFAKMIATLLTYPLIRAKVMTQTSRLSSDSILQVLRNIYKNDGPIGFYQGVWVLSYKTVLFNSLMMTVKQRVARWYSEIRSLRVEKDVLVKSEVPSPIANPQESHVCTSVNRVREMCESLCGEFPWEAAAAKKKVIYVAGAWSFLHPSHQHILNEACKRGDHVIVGIHDDETRKRGYGTKTKERFEARVERIRNFRGIHSIVRHAPWVVDRDFMKHLGISKVCAGRRCSADPRDPYIVAEQSRKFEFIEDPYDGMWKQMIRVMFSNVDTHDDPMSLASPTHGFSTASCKKTTELFRKTSRGELQISGEAKGNLRTSSFYFLFQHDAERPDMWTKRARDLKKAEDRRDILWGSPGGRSSSNSQSKETGPDVPEFKLNDSPPKLRRQQT